MSFSSVLGNIATLVRDLTGQILFEFSKYSHDTGKNTFLYAAIMYTLPTDINYDYPSRNKLTQIGSEGFLDKYPLGLPKIKLSGTFGKERRGLLYLDGLTRMNLFKAMVKHYHITEPKESKVSDFTTSLISGITGATKVQNPYYELKDNEVYVMTMYDFINSEIWVVDPNFSITESAVTKSNQPRYTLQLQAIGKPLGGKLDDMLKSTMNIRDTVLAADALLGAILTPIPERISTQIAPLWGKLKSGFSG